MKPQKNDIIDFFDGRRIGCGLVVDLNDRRLRLLTDQGKETTISANRILTAGRISGFPVGGSRDEQVVRLREICSSREDLKARIDLGELWEVVGLEARKIDAEDLTELFFGVKHDLDHISSMLRAIFEDRIYFKIRPDGIEIPTPERIEQAFLQRDKELARAKLIADSAEVLGGLKRGRAVDPADLPAGLVPMLEEAAFLGKEWNTLKSVKDIFSEAGLPPDWDPFRVLVKLGIWDQHENVRLRAERIPVEFGPEALAAAKEAASKPPPESGVDLTHLHAVTIDAVTTRDVDDALSIESEGEDLVVGIHIADAAHFVDQNSLLDREVRDRATSLYLADATIPMLPAVLSEESASLIAGCIRPAVTVLVTCGPDMTLKDHRIVRSTIKVRERLSYEHADDLIGVEGTPEARMFGVALARRRSRVEGGAIVLRDPEISVRVGEGGSVEVVRRDRESPSQVLVSEMMILANTLFASFLKEKKVPGIFRSQPPPVEKIALGDGYDPVLSYRARRAMARGDLSITAAPHATLGVDAYTTATSPLRRSVDLIVQRQIKAVLQGEPPPLDRRGMEAVLTEISFKLERATLMERERQRYFLLEYLKKRRHEEFEAVVLHQFPKFYLVQIGELGMTAALTATGGISLHPYDRVIIKVEKVDPREDKLVLSLVQTL